LIPFDIETAIGRKKPPVRKTQTVFTAVYLASRTIVAIQGYCQEDNRFISLVDLWIREYRVVRSPVLIAVIPTQGTVKTGIMAVSSMLCYSSSFHPDLERRFGMAATEDKFDTTMIFGI
jgi:hypothetical protein